MRRTTCRCKGPCARGAVSYLFAVHLRKNCVTQVPRAVNYFSAGWESQPTGEATRCSDSCRSTKGGHVGIRPNMQSIWRLAMNYSGYSSYRTACTDHMCIFRASDWNPCTVRTSSSHRWPRGRELWSGDLHRRRPDSRVRSEHRSVNLLIVVASGLQIPRCHPAPNSAKEVC